MSEEADLRWKTVTDNSVAIARFEMRIKALEEAESERKKLVASLKMAVYAAIIGGLFTVTTLIEMARAALKSFGK